MAKLERLKELMEYYDDEKAKKLYTWLMDNAEYNEEKDRYNGQMELEY